MKTAIFDLDATVADCEHRMYHIKNGSRNWPAFFDGIPDDPTIPHMVDLLQAMHKQGYKIVALTGRPEGIKEDPLRYRKTTQDWINRNIPQIEALYMRSPNDFRPGPVAKVAAIAQIKADGYDPVIAFDDHPGIVKAFREIGLPCMHVIDAESDIPKRVWKNEQFLTLVVGPVCAGKSTYTSQFPASHVVSSDEIREQLTPWKRDDPNNQEVWASISNYDHGRVWTAIHSVIEARIENALPVIVDATNIKAADRKAILALVPQGQRVKYVIIDRPLADKLRDRGWRSEELVNRMHESFQSGIKYALNGDGYDFVEVEDLRQK